MIAGATPMPPMPSAASRGTAVASADSGTISNPNSAIEGIVCSMFKTAKSGALQARRRAAATPSGNADQRCRPDRCRDQYDMAHRPHRRTPGGWLAYSWASDSASKVPARRQRQQRPHRSRPRRRAARHRAGVEALQRIDHGERGAGGEDPERRRRAKSGRRAGARRAGVLAACPAAASTSSSSAAGQNAAAA